MRSSPTQQTRGSRQAGRSPRDGHSHVAGRAKDLADEQDRGAGSTKIGPFAKSEMSSRPQRFKPTDLVQIVIDYIDSLITSGELKPGDRVIEAEISGSLSVSRVPVREAIRILAGEGLLTLVPRRSARVKPISLTTIIDMHRVLEALVSAAIEQLVEKPDLGSAIKDLRRRSDRIAKLAGTSDPMAIMKAIGSYHLNLALACENTVLVQMLQRLRGNHYWRFLTSLAEPDSFGASARAYPEITKALGRRDADTALAVLHRNMREFRARLQRAQAIGPSRTAA